MYSNIFNSHSKKSKINDLKCQTVLIQIWPDFFGMLALDPKCMLILSANNTRSQRVIDLKCQIVLIQIWLDILLCLLWIESVC